MIVADKFYIGELRAKLENDYLQEIKKTLKQQRGDETN